MSLFIPVKPGHTPPAQKGGHIFGGQQGMIFAFILASMARWTAFFGGGHSDDDEGGGSGGIGLLVMSILAPIAAMFIQMAISRSREYLADASGASFVGHPHGVPSHHSPHVYCEPAQCPEYGKAVFHTSPPLSCPHPLTHAAPCVTRCVEHRASWIRPVPSSEGDRYGPERMEPGRIGSSFSKI